MSSSVLALRRPLPRPAPAAGARPHSGPYPLGFFLFLVVNATVFVRPTDFIPGMIGWEIYQYLIGLTFLASFPAVLGQLPARRLELRPISVCVLGLLAAIVLSQVVHADLAAAFEGGKEHCKMVVYYLLLAGLVNTPARLRTFLRWLAAFATAAVLVAVLQYHGVLHLETVKRVTDGAGYDAATGTEIVLQRLTGTGSFHDPNDFCILVVVTVLANLYCLTDRRSGVARFLWVGPLLLCLYALALTHSRGGMLALLAGVFALLQARFGWRRALLLAGLLLPGLLVVFAGRQTDFSASDGTGQERLQIWREGVVMFQEAPLFGIGCNQYDKLVGRVAHNSYLHAFTELGFFGGMLFLGAWAVALAALYRYGRRRQAIIHPELRRLFPYLFGLVAGYAVGMLSLTLCYMLATYTVLGIVTAYLALVRTAPPTPQPRFDARLVGRLAGLSVVTLAGFYVVVRLFAAA
jgi:O-antigen ligase